MLRTIDDVRQHITDRDAVETAIYNWRANEFSESEIVDFLAEDIAADGTRVKVAAVAAWIAAEYPLVKYAAERALAQVEDLKPEDRIAALRLALQMAESA